MLLLTAALAGLCPQFQSADKALTSYDPGENLQGKARLAENLGQVAHLSTADIWSRMVLCRGLIALWAFSTPLN